jgi:hypothetical protein
MAHYALLDSNNIVTEVFATPLAIIPIIRMDESDTSQDWEVFYANMTNQTCKKTSYNTSGGVHSSGGTPFRKNYAGIGYSYDSTRDAFIPAQPFASWTLNEDTCWWEAPVAHPTELEDADGNPILYSWNEEDQQWNLIE